ncbi:Subtilisin-like protease SBT4.3 [Euphorbia peplus]|nr:Subtilisin-like protease SBT4.3 [Euphorbia peplus]
MANRKFHFSRLLLIGLISTILISCYGTSDDKKVYIVYMGGLPKEGFSASDLHTSMLQEATDSDGSDSLIYSYKRSFNGFAAKLTNNQMLKLAGMEGVVSIFPSEKKQLHTTRSWNFMGFSEDATRNSVIESNTIIGMLDTGIWPESESFSDKNFGPPPKKWKGTCQSSSNFTCNNKIIGARYYRSDGYFSPNDFISPRDSYGHGSHTSSTAAGNLVDQASMAGLASGTARGGVPSARIAVYKICWFDGCSDADILAAFDDAIADGVDIISISVGGYYAVDYFNDTIAIGAFHAMKHGIFTSVSAGNSGPNPGTVTNLAPWFLSVAASSIDRKFFSKVLLGNGAAYKGVSINTIGLERMYPVIYGGNAPNIKGGYNESVSRYCTEDSLNKKLVNGKIVLCDYISNGEGASVAGAIGTIMQDGYPLDVAYSSPIPSSHLNLDDGYYISQYVNKTRKPRAKIFKSTSRKDKLAPYVVTFSSRGPNVITKDILTPDVVAPGVNILAAWTQGNTVTRLIGDKRILPFNLESGTSMACPHATASAAYIKSFHPTWSPAAIKSALMTTAFPMNRDNNPEAEFAYGAGHINPVKAINPGLVYDVGEDQYIEFLCGQGYTNKQLHLITGDNTTCSKASRRSTSSDLNLPSFTLSALSGQSVGRIFYRTVTNVGSAVSKYKAIVEAPKGMKINVIPDLLSFEYVGEQKHFHVSVIAEIGNDLMSGSFIWDDGEHHVRSPIVAYVSS